PRRSSDLLFSIHPSTPIIPLLSLTVKWPAIESSTFTASSEANVRIVHTEIGTVACVGSVSRTRNGGRLRSSWPKFWLLKVKYRGNASRGNVSVHGSRTAEN